MPLQINEIHHVQITVTPAVEAATKHFYGTILGLREIDKPEPLRQRGGAWYQHGAAELHVSLEASTDNQVSKRHVCYMVADLVEAEEHLRAAGVEIILDDQPIAGWQRLYVRDPGGNRVEIAQRSTPI